MPASRPGRGEAEHAARVHCLHGQAAAHEGIENAVERHPIHGIGAAAEPGLKFGVTQWLPGREQCREDANPAARDLCAGGTDKLGRIGRGNRRVGHSRMRPHAGRKCNNVAFIGLLC